MAVKRFEYVPHTADAAFIAHGRDLSSLIENAAYAMLNLMFDVKKISGSGKSAKSIQISDFAQTQEDLLWFTLQDILSRIEIESAKAFGFKVTSLKQTKQGIKLKGELYYKEAGSGSVLLGIKAVTPHDLRVERTATGYSAKIVVDI